MLHYGFTIGRMLASRDTRPRVRFDATIRRSLRVRLSDLLQALGATGPMPPPAWVTALFAPDRELLEQDARRRRGPETSHGAGDA